MAGSPRGWRRRDALGGIATLIATTAAPGPLWAAAPFQISASLPDPILHGGLIYDVRPAGYVAEEFLLSGLANVYDTVTMADSLEMNSRDTPADLGRRTFERKVVAPHRPYTTRVVVYRPADPAKASGRVIMEPTHPIGGGMLSVFGPMNDIITANGDIHVSVSIPVTFDALKRSDPARYGALTAEHPTQIWGMLRDAGIAVKLHRSLIPAIYPTRTLIMTGYSYTGVATATFANFHHNDTRTPQGRPVYDGYLPMANATFVRPLDAPVMRMNTQSDYDSFGGLHNRSPDSDSASGRHRLYEVPGAAHIRQEAAWPGLAPRPHPLNNFVAPAAIPQGGEQATCKASFPADSRENDFPFHHYAAAALENLYIWIENGRAPPPGALIATTPDGRIRLDATGNALGGLRSSQLDVPIATYGVGSGKCMLAGYTAPFPDARINRLYGDRDGYAKRVDRRVRELVSARLLRPREAAFITAEAAQHPLG